jgi:hypothetical protein
MRIIQSSCYERKVMGEVIDLEEFRPHEVTRAVCAGCGHRVVSVAPVDAVWPRECSQCDGECFFDV